MMDRLTTKRNRGYLFIGKYCSYEMDNFSASDEDALTVLKNVMNRLGAYEDTGLMPEEIVLLKTAKSI